MYCHESCSSWRLCKYRRVREYWGSGVTGHQLTTGSCSLSPLPSPQQAPSTHTPTSHPPIPKTPSPTPLQPPSPHQSASFLSFCFKFINFLLATPTADLSAFELETIVKRLFECQNLIWLMKETLKTL